MLLDSTHVIDDFNADFMKMYAFLQILVIPKVRPRITTRDEEKEESASHHVKIFICFAQLRAKMCEKDSREPLETTGKQEKNKF